MMIYVMCQTDANTRALDNALTWLADKEIGRVHCSPTSDAQASARAASRVLDAAMTLDDDLREIDFGSVTDALWRQGIFERWMQGEADAAFAGGERFSHAYRRFAEALGRVPAQVPALLITHGAIVRSVLPYLCVNAAALQVRDPLAQGGFVVLERYDAERYICRSWNLVEHLEE